jgi:hypothetical protein
MMGIMDAITLLLAVVATARITRLITTDRITQAPRSWAVRRLPEHHLLAYLIVCDWCASVYVGAGVGAAWWGWGDEKWFTAACLALAGSYAAGWLASWDRE